MYAARLRLYARLQSAAHALNKQADRILLDAAGVTAAQAAVLALAAGEGGVTQKEAAAALGLNESALTAMAARLERLELVHRKTDPRDARRRRLVLSEKGREAMMRARPAFQTVNDGIEASLGEEEAHELARMLGVLTGRFAGGEAKS